MNRRDMLKGSGLSAAAALFSLGGALEKAWARDQTDANKGTTPLKITKVRAILTAPQKVRFVVVKVETSEPGQRLSAYSHSVGRLRLAALVDGRRFRGARIRFAGRIPHGLQTVFKCGAEDV